MRIVAVTGATGKTGQQFLNELLSNRLDDYHFRFLVRNSYSGKKAEEGRQLLQRLEGDIVHADLLSGNNLNSLFVDSEGKTADTLIHIAGIRLSEPLIPIALKCGVTRLILVHTAAIYSNYKQACEEYKQIEERIHSLVSAYNENGQPISLTILRPTMIYGDLDDHNVAVFIRMVDHLRFFPTINGAKYPLQPVWSGDVGRALYSILVANSLPENEYIISGREPITLREMLQEIQRQLGVKNVFFSVPFWLAYFGAWLIYLLSFSKVDYREKVQRMIEPRAFPHEKATRDFGYNPKCFADGVVEEIRMYKENKK